MLPKLTPAEQIALDATKLPSFPVNIEEIRRTVADLLTEFGRYGFFNEYTTHSFDHVHGLLESLNWIIPETTKPLLTKGDWWLVVLACYLHDLGLVVTRDEFEARHQTKFEEFCNSVLFAGPDAEDYREKINGLGREEGEKLLYQEFVRYHHASRIRDWINGTRTFPLGKAEAVASELERLLAPLADTVRNDLAAVCESHNLNDLDNENKYPLFQPYGLSPDETVNVQYAAIILRTADLVQITNRRAPSVLFRLINPKDPISQVEWLKQNAVTHIRSLPKEDRSGEISKDVQSDTIQVFADFKQSEGFFGLTSYLRYAERELQLSNEIIEKSKRKLERKVSFPWRFIDDSQVKAKGFEPKQYGFELDQEKILDLLTGHTLYNDSAVVLRELAQNAIDAVRLQADEEGKSSEDVGSVLVRWDSKTSELEVLDNGTGMTQDIIENHLLKVGSSRYQDDKFKEGHPNFSPISRFGIGVLSTFMIADEVEIVTCSPQEDQARQISLRSVHGKYLIRILDKQNDESAKRLAPHGTSVKLKLRPSAKRVDILKTIRQWVMFPRCRFRVQIDDGQSVVVGFSSPKAAMESYVKGYSGRGSDIQYRVEERVMDGLSIAYALVHNSYFREWTFMQAPDQLVSGEGTPICSICVEGITVELGSPGFRRGGILAIANATGAGAPKTNVARSSLEDTDEKTKIMLQCYNSYVAQIDAERVRLIDEEKYPLSRVVNQLPYLCVSLEWGGRLDDYYRHSSEVLHPQLLRDAFSNLPIFLLEEETGRVAASLKDLLKKGSFWTAESPLTASIESLIREMPVDVTARSLLGFAKGNVPQLPEGPIVSNLGSRLANASINEVFEITRIRAVEEGHRLELEWAPASGAWISGDAVGQKLQKIDIRAMQEIRNAFESRYAPTSYDLMSRAIRGEIKIPTRQIPSDGLSEFTAIRAVGDIYLLPKVKCVEALLPLMQSEKFSDLAGAYIFLQLVGRLFSVVHSTTTSTQQLFERSLKSLAASGVDRYLLNLPALDASVLEENWRAYNPFAWSRSEQQWLV